MNFLISDKVLGRIVFFVFIAAAIIFPFLLKDTNPLCRIAGVILPLICEFIITLIFHSDYGYWPWKSERQE